jgi:hypothetical protein
MSATRPIPTVTLGAELERDRLELRVRWMTVAVDSLRQRASQHRREHGALPRHLRQANAEFEAQIDALEARLRELAQERTSIQIERRSGSPGNDY